MDKPGLLPDVCRWVGVAIALVGSIVVAPGGARLLWRVATDWVRHRRDVVRAHLTRVLPFLRRHHRVAVVGRVGTTSSFGAATMSASGSAWIPGAPVDERIDRLRQQLLDVERRLGEVQQRVRTETQDRQEALSRLEAALRTEVAELSQRLDDQEQRAAMIDARGLPVIGFGILLSGIPDELARIPFGLGWTFPAFGFAAALVAMTHAVQERRSVRQQ